MPLTLLLGGARAGKSTVATRMAKVWGRPVTVIATAEARDSDMTERIERHRRDRPAGWETIEEPVALAEALRKPAEETGVIVDCLTLWTSNLFEHDASDEDIVSLAREAAAIASERPGPTIVVTNEVGLGVVPATQVGRRFRDVLGSVNATFAEAAEDAHLVVAGHLLPLQHPGGISRDR